MINKFYNNIGDAYIGRGILDVFSSQGLASQALSASILSRISNRAFGVEGMIGSSSQRIGTDTDADGIVYYAFRKGVYADDMIFYKLLNPDIAHPYVAKLNDYLTNIEFTIQMTCTYEQFSNYCGIMGIHKASNPVGLCLGQYENGRVYWGFFPVTINGSPNQPVRFSRTTAQMPTGKFNWAFVYDSKYSGLTGSTNNLFFYINGQSMGVMTMPSNWTWTNSTDIETNALSLGYSYRSTNRNFKGNLYSLLIYNRALDNNEIKHNYEVDKVKFLLP